MPEKNSSLFFLSIIYHPCPLAERQNQSSIIVLGMAPPLAAAQDD